ncbi:MAG: hypothetical protein EOP73_28110, partial [Variovorax sp.]
MFGIETAWARWALAGALTASAAAVNQVLQPLFEERAPLILYFPALLAISFFAGLWPAVASLVSAVGLLSISLGLWEPSWHAPETRDALLLGAFCVAGGLGIAVTQAARGLVMAYRGTRARLNLALAAGRMTAWEWDVVNSRVWLAPGAEAVIGRGGVNADEAWRMVHADDRERVAQAVHAALEGRDASYSFMHRLLRPDGELHWVET